MSRARGAMGKFLNSLPRSIYPIILFSLWVFFACGTSCVRVFFFAFFRHANWRPALFLPPGQSRSFISRGATIQCIIFDNSNEGVFLEPLFGLFYSFEGLEVDKKVFFPLWQYIVICTKFDIWGVQQSYLFVHTCAANLQYFCNISYYIALNTNHFVLWTLCLSQKHIYRKAFV